MDRPYWGRIVGLALLLVLSNLGHAADIPWKSPRYTVTADKQSIVEVIRGFANDQGLSVDISEDIKGDISGRFDAPPQEFLDVFCQQNGLVWYYDGTKLFVSPSSTITTKIYQLRSIQVEALMRALKQVGILTERYPIRVVDDLGLVYVPGPPRYQELVDLTLQTLEAAAAPNSRTRLTTRMYRLRYAWAEDQVVIFRDSEVVLPGVATTLRNLVNGKGAQRTFVPGGNTARNPRTFQGLNGSGLARFGGQPINYGSPIYGQYPPSVSPGVPGTPSQVGAVAQASADEQPDMSDAIGPPSIQADARLNAVIIQDVETRFPAYDKLISELDVAGGLVEIEATIVDIDADSGFEFGPPLGATWQNGAKTESARFGISTTDVASTSLTLVTEQATQFALSLQALRTKGQAELVSQPSVLTMNNVEAQLDSTQTFFVRVAGQLQVDLFDVVVGTSLRVTPHIVEQPDGTNRIQLLVKVEDGTQQAQGQAIDGIPVIQRSTINTQAVLDENQSLLLGGLMRSEQRSRKRGIPGLMNIPKVGFLFSSTTTSTIKTQRYILLKPRIVELPNLNCSPLDSSVPQSHIGIFPGMQPDIPMMPSEPVIEDQPGVIRAAPNIPGTLLLPNPAAPPNALPAPGYPGQSMAPPGSQQFQPGMQERAVQAQFLQAPLQPGTAPAVVTLQAAPIQGGVAPASLPLPQNGVNAGNAGNQNQGIQSIGNQVSNNQGFNNQGFSNQGTSNQSMGNKGAAIQFKR